MYIQYYDMNKYQGQTVDGGWTQCVIRYTRRPF